MSSGEKIRMMLVSTLDEIRELPDDSQPDLLRLAMESLDRHDQIRASTEQSIKATKLLEDAEADRSLAIQYALFDAECIVRETCDRR